MKHYKHYLSKQLHGIDLTYLLQYLPSFLIDTPYSFFLSYFLFLGVYLLASSYLSLSSSQLSIMRHISISLHSVRCAPWHWIVSLFISTMVCRKVWCGVDTLSRLISSSLSSSFIILLHFTVLNASWFNVWCVVRCGVVQCGSASQHNSHSNSQSSTLLTTTRLSSPLLSSWANK